MAGYQQGEAEGKNGGRSHKADKGNRRNGSGEGQKPEPDAYKSHKAGEKKSKDKGDCNHKTEGEPQTELSHGAITAL